MPPAGAAGGLRGRGDRQKAGFTPVYASAISASAHAFVKRLSSHVFDKEMHDQLAYRKVPRTDAGGVANAAQEQTDVHK